MVLHAYFDDSGSHEQSDHYVVGGILVREPKLIPMRETWEALRREHGLTWFHMAAAESGREEFADRSRWPQPRRHECIQRFAEIVDLHVAAAIGVAVSTATFGEIIAPLADDRPLRDAVLRSPYFLLWLDLLVGLAVICKEEGISQDDVEIIFATQKKIGPKVREYWRDAARKNGYKSEPTFRRPQDLPQLQAADMIAWRTLRSLARPEEPIPARHLPLMRAHSVRVISKDELLDLARISVEARAEERDRDDA